MAHREDFKEPTRSAAALESPLRSPLRRMSESHDNPFGLLAFAQLVTVCEILLCLAINLDQPNLEY